MSVGGTGRVWEALAAYESMELVRRLCKERTGREPNAGRAREIASHFAQGREYFRSAGGAGELVRSLILYYGAMSLARGLILFLDPSVAAPMRGGHGLTAGGWENLNKKPESVPQLAVKVQDSGTFPELSRVTQNVERTRVPAETVPNSIGVLSPGTNPLPAGTELEIAAILGQIPDAREAYERVFGGHGERLLCEVRAVQPSDDATRKGSAWIGLPETGAGLPSRKRVADALGRPEIEGRPSEEYLWFAGDPARQAALHYSFSLEYERNPPEGVALDLPLTADGAGELHLKLPTGGARGGVVLSTLLALYLASYAAGMLVRYHPGYWMAVVGHGKGDAVAPVLAAATSAVGERFPRLVLEQLEGWEP